MVKIKTKTMSDGTKVQVFYKEKDDQYKTFTHPIVNVIATHVRVISSKGTKYWVKLSDKVRMTMKPKVHDTAVIMPLDNGWLVVDIEEYIEEEESEYHQLYKKWVKGTLTDEEKERYEWLKKNDEELLEQEKELEDLWGDY